MINLLLILIRQMAALVMETKPPPADVRTKSHRDTCLVSRLSLSRHGFSCLDLGLVSTLVCLVLAVSRVSMSRHVSSHDCILSLNCDSTVSGIDKCLSRAEALASGVYC